MSQFRSGPDSELDQSYFFYVTNGNDTDASLELEHTRVLYQPNFINMPDPRTHGTFSDSCRVDLIKLEI